MFSLGLAPCWKCGFVWRVGVSCCLLGLEGDCGKRGRSEVWVSEEDNPNRDVAGLGYTYFHWRGIQRCTLSCLVVIPS